MFLEKTALYREIWTFYCGFKSALNRGPHYLNSLCTVIICILDSIPFILIMDRSIKMYWASTWHSLPFIDKIWLAFDVKIAGVGGIGRARLVIGFSKWVVFIWNRLKERTPFWCSGWSWLFYELRWEKPCFYFAKIYSMSLGRTEISLPRRK